MRRHHLNLEALKSSFIIYTSHFSMYDYIAFSWLILTFFIALLLAILLAKKSALLSIVVLLFSLVLLGGGPFVLKHILDGYLRPTRITLNSVKKLHFSNILFVDISLQNISKHPFNICTINAKIHKQSSNSLKNFIDTLKPLRKKSIVIQKSIDVNQTRDVKITFYNFSYDKDVNATITSECY
jgi:hypothetical protein